MFLTLALIEVNNILRIMMKSPMPPSTITDFHTDSRKAKKTKNLERKKGEKTTESDSGIHNLSLSQFLSVPSSHRQKGWIEFHAGF